MCVCARGREDLLHERAQHDAGPEVLPALDADGGDSLGPLQQLGLADAPAASIDLRDTWSQLHGARNGTAAAQMAAETLAAVRDATSIIADRDAEIVALRAQVVARGRAHRQKDGDANEHDLARAFKDLEPAAAHVVCHARTANALSESPKRSRSSVRIVCTSCGQLLHCWWELLPELVRRREGRLLRPERGDHGGSRCTLCVELPPSRRLCWLRWTSQIHPTGWLSHTGTQGF